MWVTHSSLHSLSKFLLPSTCVVLRPVVCTSTLFLWTVRKPLSRHWDLRYWLRISVHCPLSPVITFCLLAPLTPGLATSEPLLPVAGDCRAPDNVRGWHGPMVSRHTTKAARTLNLKIYVAMKYLCDIGKGPLLAQNIVHEETDLRIYWIHKKNLSEEGWHGHCSHLGPRPPSVSQASYKLQTIEMFFNGDPFFVSQFQNSICMYLFCPYCY